MSKQKNDVILGIDAGGTFTDLALISEDDLEVVSYTKVPTDRSNMIETIRAGLKNITEENAEAKISSISIATTFATNALVENRSRSTALILAGYDRERVEAARRNGKFATDRIIVIGGGHDAKGNEKEPLDTDQLKYWLKKNLDGVESIAISSFFSVRNPEHELRIKKIVTEMAPQTYITCGHELTCDLDAILRAVTASLNANLIPIVMELFNSVEQVFGEQGIKAPVSVVKSDGSLVGIQWAKMHPIETILSGPAASAVGARHLAGKDVGGSPSWVFDMGGTTTDIIHLNEKGYPSLNPDGAVVGEHKTLIKTIDIYTFGLGGDSRIIRDERSGKIQISSKRVLPLCTALSGNETKFPKENAANLKYKEPLFVFRGETTTKRADSFEAKVLNNIGIEPISAELLISDERIPNIALKHLENLEENGIVKFAGFTPTDMLHVCSKLSKWDKRVSCCGAAILKRDGQSLESFCEEVQDAIAQKIAYNILLKSFSSANRCVNVHGEAEKIFFDALFCSENQNARGPKIHFELDGIIIGAGAPAWAFVADIASRLGCPYLLPKFAEVTGAVGAAVGTFSQNYIVWINPVGKNVFRAHLPSKIMDFDKLEDAVLSVQQHMDNWLKERAEQCGVKAPVIRSERKDEIISSGGSKIHIWTELRFSVQGLMRDGQ